MTRLSPFLAVCGCLLLIPPALTQSRGPVSLEQRLYELVTTTSMPHLEENLRYTSTREKRCLHDADLRSAFPVLRHASLKGCALGDETREHDTISYVLVCEGGNTTKGSAVWRIGEHQITGVLNVKLGGKNLTFYQRVTGKPLGPCASP